MEKKGFNCQSCQEVNCNTAGGSCCLKRQAKDDRLKKVEEKIKAKLEGGIKC